MKNIIANILRGGGKPLSYLLAALFAFAAAQTAQAATDTSWNGGTGGTEASPKQLYNKDNWKSGKVPSTSYNLVFGVDSLVATNNHTSAKIANDIKVNGGNYMFLGPLEFSTLWTVNSGSSDTIVKKGNWKLTYGYRQAIAANSYSAITNASGNMQITGEHYIRVGEGKNSTAIIENQNGNWTLAHNLQIGNGEGSKGEIYWRKGNLSFSKDKTLYIGSGKNSNGKVEIYGGTWTSTNNIHVASGEGATATLLLKGGTINAKGSLYIGNSTVANGTMTVDSGTLNVASGKNTYIGRGSGGTGTLTVNGGTVNLGGDCIFGDNGGTGGTLTVNGGTVTVNSGKWTKSAAGSGTINLNTGGTLVTQHFQDESAGGSLTINFNGGTLKANNAHADGLFTHGAGTGLNVNVGANGGTLNTDSRNLFVHVPVNAVETTAGAFTVTGGGSVTFTAMGSFAGTFSVGENTTLRWFDQDATVAAYTIAALNVAPGATLYLDADATGPDAISATTTNITATAASPATVRLIVRAMPTSGQAFPLFAMDEADIAKVNVVAETTAGASLVVEKGYADGYLTYAIIAKDYFWNASQTYWGGTGAWDVDNVASDWADNNNAVFNTANAEATLAANVTAIKLDFRDNAAVAAGGGTLTVPEVSVATSVSAMINAPIVGSLEKNGTGTLSLGAARTDQTTLAEGTLVMSGDSATVDGSKLTLGNDAAKPVTFDYGGKALSKDLLIDDNLDVTLTNGTYTLSRVVNGKLRVAKDATLNAKANSWTPIGPSSAIDCTTNLLEVSGGRVDIDGGKHFPIGDDGGDHSTAEVHVLNGGVLTTAYDIYVGNRAAAALTIDDGEVSTAAGKSVVFCYGAQCVSGRDCAVNLNAGGMLSTATVCYGSGSAAATLAFDGGTLKALATDQSLIQNFVNMTVAVKSAGGTIDANGKTVTIEEPLLGDAVSSGGGMTFKGGGVVTLASGNTYTGKTTVELGTTVHVPAPGEIGGGIAVTVTDTPPADGVYKLVVIDGEGTFNASVLSGVVAPANATLRLSGDNTSILCIYGNPPNTWVGGASGSLNDNANWSLGTVPAAGESCVIGNLTAASLTNPSGSAFAPAVITFPADTALVTISGEGVISGITAITNNASLHHVFSCPVVCADNITPDITRGSGNYMTFAGGITMYNAPKTGSSTVDYWSGNVAVTTESAQEYKSGGNYGRLVVGTTFSFDNGMIDHMYIEPGATAVVNRLAYNNCVRSSKKDNKTAWYNLIFDNGNGVLRAKEIKAIGDAVLFHSYADSDQQGGTIIAEKLTSATTATTGGGGWSYPIFFLNCGQTTGSEFIDNAANGEGVWVIGRGGLSFGSDAIAQSFYGVHLGKTLDNGRPAATLHSYEDWALDVHPLGASQTALEISSGHGELLVIDTSHYAVGDPVLDAATSHTVTLNGRVKGDGAMRIEGNGKVVFANANNTFAGTLTVTNTATVEVKAGSTLGTCAVTMASGTTLAVAQSGTVALGGSLTLKNGACLGFNFTNRSNLPMLDVTDKTVAFDTGATTNITVKITSDVGWPKGGTKTLTTGGGFTGVGLTLVPDAEASKWATGVSVDETTGNIVLAVKPMGLVFFVQ